MDYRKYRSGRLTGCTAAALAALAAPAALAQQAPAQQTPAPAPAPTPSPTRSGPPNVMYLPNVVPERFSIGGTPTPTPTPAPIPVPSPVTVPTPAARANAPAARPAQTSPRATAPAPAPSAVPTPEALPQLSAPQPGAVPATTPLPTPAATPPAAAPGGTPGWLWALGGAAGMALLLGAFWVLRRRRPADEAFEAAPEPVAVPEPPVRATPPGIAPRAEPARPQAAPAAPASNPDDPFELAVRPLRVELGAEQVELEIELLIGNRQSAAAEAIRPALALISANPDQDRQIAGFLANPLAEGGGQAFDLAAGAGGRMSARLRVRREHIHVVEVGGRPMFVPVVMVALRWRGGLSIRRFGAAFMVGTAGQGAKLGPIWLDRALAAPLAATRYVPRPAPVAA